MLKKLRKYLASALVLTAAIGIAGVATPSVAQEDNLRFVAISHAPDGDSFWTTVQNAYALAAKHEGVTVEYRNPPTGDVADMARLIEQAAASNPDGLIVTIPDISVVGPAIQAAEAKGIPVLSMNTGTTEDADKLGIPIHVGQAEYAAGLGAGKRAKEAGVTNFLCVNHFIYADASVQRCKGFADGIGQELGSNMIDSGVDPGEIKNKVAAYLRANPDTKAILTLGPTPAIPTIAVLDELGLSGQVFFVTFDVSPEINAAIKSGTINFAIDQQPFLQAYLPVVFLANLKRYGVLPVGHISSGPGFITKDNVATVEKWAGQYR